MSAGIGCKVEDLAFPARLATGQFTAEYGHEVKYASMGTAGTKALCGHARRGLEATPGRGGRPRGR